jgi:D-serine deaminase-like pyridoxal phosphate-dependent protein
MNKGDTMPNGNEVGLRKSEIDTPALLIDLDAMERNIRTMESFFAGKAVKLRPHVKLHKATPVLSHLQLRAAGVIGLTCAKLAEAELLGASGIKDILIANQIVGAQKIRRLVNLAAYTDVMVAVDNPENVAELSAAAQARNVKLRVLVEVNVGHNRCGVAPFGPAMELAKAVKQAPGLRFMGLMGYDGHCSLHMDPSKREGESRKANQLLVDTAAFIEKAGLKVEIVSGSGSFTYKIAAGVKGITEIQAGTYLLMDTAFREKGIADFDCTLSVLSTVTSRPSWPGGENIAIIDVGRKQMDTILGLPEVKSPAGGTIFSMMQEHARMRLEGPALNLRVGDKIELWVRDANGTINQHNKFYALRKDIVEAVWDIPGRGRAT